MEDLNSPLDDLQSKQKDKFSLEFEELNPAKIYFSQNCVSERRQFRKELYKPIIVAKYETHYVSYDNRRLLAAAN
jgi:hypothetical protein